MTDPAMIPVIEGIERAAYALEADLRWQFKALREECQAFAPDDRIAKYGWALQRTALREFAFANAHSLSESFENFAKKKAGTIRFRRWDGISDRLDFKAYQSRLFAAMFSPDGGWARLAGTGPGISWTRSQPLFSERMGHRRPFATFGPWRVFWLSAKTP